MLKNNLPLIKNNKTLSALNLKIKNYFLITLHRPESVDDPKKLKKLILDFEKLGRKFKTKFIFPVHPRTNKISKNLNYTKQILLSLFNHWSF